MRIHNLFPVLVAAGLMTLPMTSSAVGEKTTKPNILIIFADDLGYGDLGCFGKDESAVETPNIDRLTQEGMKFTDWISASSVCSPSRAALLTGRYPMRCGLPVCPPASSKNFPPEFEQNVGLPVDEVTIPKLLKPMGYLTAMFGKSHLGDEAKFHPMDLGFDRYFGVNQNIDKGSGPLLDDRRAAGEISYREVHQKLTEKTCEFMKEAKEQGKPFLIYLSHYLVHTPIIPNDRFMEKGAPSPAGKYRALVRELDWNIGEVMNSLKELGLDETTMVFFLSDNGPTGPGSAQPLRGGKYYTLEGGNRVPAIVRWPGTIPAGRISDKLCSTLDILPTIAAVSGASRPDDRKIDGKSLLPLLQGDADAQGHEVLFYYNGLTLEVVRKGNWKLHLPRKAANRAWWAVQSKDGYGNLTNPVLFNLQNDIAEAHDVADKHPEVVKDLLALAEGARKELGDWNRTGSNQRAVNYEGNPNNPIGRKNSTSMSKKEKAKNPSKEKAAK